MTGFKSNKEWMKKKITLQLPLKVKNNSQS